jgi:hypothetical protein
MNLYIGIENNREGVYKNILKIPFIDSEDMEQNLNIIKAFFVAPLAAPLLYFFGVIFFGGVEQIKEMIDLVMIVFFIFVSVTPVSYLITAIFGVPIFYLLKKNNCLSLKYLSFSGLFLGGILFILFFTAITGFRVDYSFKEYLLFFLVGGGMGLGVSYLFGYILGLTK